MKIPNQSHMKPSLEQLKKIRLVVSDMDGTLLNEKGQLPQNVPQLIRKLGEKNVLFATASGRTWEAQKRFFSNCQEQMTCICDNGAVIMHHGKQFFLSELKEELWKRIVAKCLNSDFGCAVVICGTKGTYMVRNQELQSAVDQFYSKLQYIERFDEVKDQIFKLSVCCLSGTEKAVLEELQSCFSQHASLVSAHPRFIDVMNIGINKAAGVARLQEYLGLSAEEIMAFGDYYNDIEMLKQAGVSYIMDNAPDSMKQYALFRAPSNERNGVITVLEDTLLRAL